MEKNETLMEKNTIVRNQQQIGLVVDERCEKCLTEREREVLKYVIMGKSNTEIARELIISVHTAKAHVCSILRKMSVDDRVQAAVKAVRENLINF